MVFEFYEKVIPTALFTFSSDMHTTNLVLKSARKNLLYILTINTTTYGYRSMKFHCAKLWNDTFKKGIAIDGFGKNNVSLSQLHDKSNFKMTLKNISSLQLHSWITIYYITRSTLFINYLMPPFFPFPSPLLCICPPPTPLPILYLFIYFLLKYGNEASAWMTPRACFFRRFL